MSGAGRRRVASVLLGLVAMGALLAPGQAAAKSYRLPSIRMDVDVQADGSFSVAEHRTYDFDGDFSFAFIRFDPGPYRFSNAVVSERGEQYQRVEVDQRVPGTYTFDGREVRWNYRARNERRMFQISYEVSGHILAYDDVAEFDWKFLGDTRDAPVDDFVAFVHLPPGALLEQVRAWGHGPLEGEVSIQTARDIMWHAPGVRADQTVIGRVAFPASLVPQAPRARGVRLPQILAEERRLADEANAARTRTRWWNIGAVLAALASLSIFLLLYAAYGKEHEARAPGDYLRELPHDYPPAIVGYLQRFGTVKPLDMVATLMDLARRGYLRISEVREDGGIFARDGDYEYTITVVRSDLSGLTPYEADVLNLLVEADGARGITARDLKDWAKADPERMRSRFTSFQNAVAEHGRRIGLIEQRAWVIGLNALVALAAGAIAVLAIAAANPRDPLDVVRNSPGSLIAILILAVQVASSLALRQRTLTGARHHARWRAFARFLKDFSRMHEYRPPAVAMWERYLVYAIPLGAADAVADAIKIHAPPEVAERGFSWYAPSDRAHATGGSVAVSFGDSIGGFTSSFTASAQAAFATAPSSGSGGGGGFSGGGGGGSGGGGSSGAG